MTWRVIQGAGIVATVGLLVGLLRWPDPTLNILWNAVIPILPATFLINPMLWRNACPLATLTTLTGDRVGTRVLTGEAVRHTLLVGAALLAVLVTGRRLLFNTDGPALAGVITLVGGIALAGGGLFERKAGFCNSICPVLPVERLYGQLPLLRVANARCTPCTLCTERGCIDRSRADALGTAIGPRAATSSWMHSPYGYFAAGFPGFIAGYFTVENAPIRHAAAVFGHVGLYTVTSIVTVMLVVRILGLRATTALPILGATAAGLYYWFAGPAITEAWQWPTAAAWGIRATALALVGAWLWRALRSARPSAPPRAIPRT